MNKEMNMEPREAFFKSIHNYYLNLVASKVPIELINGVSDIVTDFYYEQYNRFKRQYPKSAKRYSAFQFKDLEHPTTFEMIIKYFKENDSDNYKDYSMILLRMTLEELIAFEKSREEFYKMR